MSDKFLKWAQELAAVAQSGLNYTKSPFERERFEKVRAIAAEMFDGSVEGGSEVAARVMAEAFGYATPKVGVRGAVFKDDRVLLVKEKVDGCWSLPGGWADVGISPADNAVKEVREESGIETVAVKLIAVYDRNKHFHGPPLPMHIYKLMFLCEITGGALTTSIETDDADFFALDELPPLSLFRTNEDQIKRAYEHWKDRDLPTDFD